MVDNDDVLETGSDDSLEFSPWDDVDDDGEEIHVPGSFQPMLFDVSQRRVRDLVSDYHNKELDPRPSFQRGYVWDKTKASKLIESVLLNVPLPLVYTAEEKDGKEVVIDGQQRLMTLFSFIDGKFPKDGKPFKLSKLKIISEINGKTFNDLESGMQKKIQKYNMQIIKINSESDGSVKFEIFERLNSGSVSLNAQELRNCVYRGKFNELLRELAAYENFRAAISVENVLDRMKDAELALRFLAFYEKSYLNYPGGMKSFLNEFMSDFRNLSDEKSKKFSEQFKKASDLSYSVFGSNAFRRYSAGSKNDPNGQWERTVNRALYDITMWGFSQYEKHQIIPKADEIRSAMIDLILTDDEFRDAITAATGDRGRVVKRFDAWRERLETIVDEKVGERFFDLSIKRALFEQNKACAICKQLIQGLDDAEVDHIVPFSQGGKTELSNAQLSHRYCNRSKGSQLI